ncbi:CpaD family pilus assembly lipoprotein [Marinomonas transparens]|uniref:Pilus assembly protein CpaD n=1 Tax=Marinomonas transparens TaxID=2795388 RepID=A0A934JL98_9GAMM|nr:CpaD family pilus assembly lipoprotein [Marinomonas transparens]MBJ7536144.1 pilus assembly protein CpaD [Marinomonas transparens]
MRFMIFSVVFLLLLSGCDHTVNRLREDSNVFEHGVSRSSSVKPTMSSISLSVQDTGGLDQPSLQSLNALLRNQGRLSNQVIRIQPLSEKGEQFAQRLEASLLELGMNKSHLTLLPLVYRVSKTEWDLQLTSEALVVLKPDCSIADKTTWTVKPFDAVGPLGCANRANIAQMVVNPRDLMRPSALDAGDAVTAVGAVQRYQEGDTTELLDIDFQAD